MPEGRSDTGLAVEMGSLRVLELGPLESSARDVFLDEVDTFTPQDRQLAVRL